MIFKLSGVIAMLVGSGCSEQVITDADRKLVITNEQVADGGRPYSDDADLFRLDEDSMIINQPTNKTNPTPSIPEITPIN